MLDELGIVYEEFGFNTIVVRTIPMWLTKTNVEHSIKHIIDIIISGEEFKMEKFIDKVAATCACKASIRANENITLKDMEILIERLRACDNPFTCAHGRPCIITYTRYDLDKLFKRALC